MRAKKQLGQHFLTSHSYAERIVDAGAVTEEDVVLEIGPGKGILTEKLLQRAKKVIVIEKDADMLPILHEKFESDEKNGRLIITHADIRDISLEELVPEQYKVIANIPYYITGELIRMFLTQERRPVCIVFLVQKEVAERIVARDKKESLLSLSVKAYGEPKIIATVKAGSFSPPPKVDSAILAIEHISRERFENSLKEQRFFELIHAGFSHKRKLLKKNLEVILSQDQIQNSFEVCSVNSQARAEDIPLETWFCTLKTL